MLEGNKRRTGVQEKGTRASAGDGARAVGVSVEMRVTRGDKEGMLSLSVVARRQLVCGGKSRGGVLVPLSILRFPGRKEQVNAAAGRSSCFGQKKCLLIPVESKDQTEGRSDYYW